PGHITSDGGSPSVAPSPALYNNCGDVTALGVASIRWRRFGSRAPSRSRPSAASAAAPGGRPLPRRRPRTQSRIGCGPLAPCRGQFDAFDLGGRRDLASDRPQKGRDLAGDGGDHDGQFLARGTEPAIARTQPDLRLPGDVANRLWQTLEPRAQG